MMSLWKEIKRHHGANLVSAANQLPQITSKCRRIARDIRDLWWMKIQDALNHRGLGPGAWWVEQDKVNVAYGSASEPIGYSGCDHARVRRLRILYISTREAYGSRIRFNGNDLFELSRQGQREQPDTTVKIECALAGHITQCEIDQ